MRNCSRAYFTSSYQRPQEFSLLIQLIMWRTNVGVLYDIFMGFKEKTLGLSEINRSFQRSKRKNVGIEI